MATFDNTQIVVIGAGIAGIACAYYLGTGRHKNNVLLLDETQPMSFTSAHSGDNYRNWWPHPTMVQFSNYSIDSMERIAAETSNVFNMTRRGYALATADNDIDDLVSHLHDGFGADDENMIRYHSGPSPESYSPPVKADWQTAPDGVDIVSGRRAIGELYPSFSDSIQNIIHVRRAGDFSGQQLGQYMLGRIKHADVLVNAAGPLAQDIAAMIGIELPVRNVFQQKIAFEDRLGAVPRDLPFSVFLDAQELNWTQEHRELLADDPQTAWLTRTMPGGPHCRPEGGDNGTWIKLGWAYNDKPLIRAIEGAATKGIL